jgi:hypothetical protein
MGLLVTMYELIVAGFNSFEQPISLLYPTFLCRSPEAVKFLFDSEDLMETGIHIRDANVKSTHLDRILGLIKIDLATPTLDELCSRFRELSPTFGQLGMC